MADKNETYMLSRDKEESARLNQQHELIKVIYGGDLIDSSIPLQGIQSVADVATGTGIWLQHVGTWLESHPSAKSSVKCVGFDISDAQFPKQLDASNDRLRFQVHDVTTPFPEEYWETFDLVHVRLLSFALKADVLDDAIKNVVQLIKPGGYLQWEDGDIFDSITIPETQKHKKFVAVLQAERAARGLTPSMTQAVLRSLTNLRQPSPPAPAPTGTQIFSPNAKVNLVTWSPDHALRVLQVQTHSTIDKDSELVRAHLASVIWIGAKGMLHLYAARQRDLVRDGGYADDDEKEALLKLAREVEELAEDEELATARWETEGIRFVAKKVVFRGLLELGWNEVKFPRLRDV